MISLNRKAMKIVRQIIDNTEDLGCEIIQSDCGATIIDMGLNAPGSWEAAELFVRADLGDLCKTQLGNFTLNEHYKFSTIEIHLDQPLLACLASQIAGWVMGDGEFATIGSGPARSLAVLDSDWYFGDMTNYRDEHHEAVLCVQDQKYPVDEVLIQSAEACHVKPEDFYVLITKTASMTGSMQVSARVMEQICHKFFEKGFDAGQIVHMRGSAPIAPFVKDELKSMGRVNDALIYGSELEVWVDSTDEQIAKVVHQLSGNTSSPRYGDLFEDVFVDCEKNFFNVDHDIHSVAKVQIHNINTGKAFWSGEINYDALERSLLR